MIELVVVVILVAVTMAVSSARLARIERRLAAQERTLAALLSGEPPADPPSKPAPERDPRQAELPLEPAAAPPRSPMPQVARDRSAPPRPAAENAAETAPSAARGDALTARWLVWLGALATGLSAVFLVAYAAAEGWLGPGARVILGIALGLALLAGGEAMLRRTGRERGDTVAAGLTAAGLFALFVSVFAAHALHGFVGPAAAFAALGAVAAAALLLALRHGRLVAALGLAAAYVVPALVQSESAAPLPVFLYLGAVTAGCLGLTVWRRWWWLSAATLAGALGWPALWLLAEWRAEHQGVLGGYALGIAALFALLAVRLPVPEPGRPATAWIGAVLSQSAGAGFALSGLLLVAIAGAAGFDGEAFLQLGLYAALGLALGRRRAGFEALGVIAALVTLAAVLAWPQPATVSPPSEIARLGVESIRTGWGPIVMPPEFTLYARALAGLGLLFGLGGFLALARSERPGVWAALSAAMPLILFAVAFWRIGAFEIDIRWAALATGLAGLALLAAIRLPSGIEAGARRVVLAIYAGAVTGALALAATCALAEAWLTVALALEVAALAWIGRRLGVAELRPAIWLMVVLVILRLTANPQVLDYEGGVSVFAWVIYGYGVPAAALLSAARMVRTGEGDRLARLCEIAGTGCLLLLGAFQLRFWTAGGLDAGPGGLFDRAVQALWWLAGGALLLRREVAERAAWAPLAGGGVTAVAVLYLVFGVVLLANPLVEETVIGRLPVANLLGLAYLAPALLLWRIGADPGFRITPALRPAFACGAAALGVLYLTLETRHLWQGEAMVLTPDTWPRDGEVWSYSAVWAAAALALVLAGLGEGRRLLRHAGLGVLLLTVLKVFLWDMAGLEGLWRVASFLGLGLTLFAVGQLYRRVVARG